MAPTVRVCFNSICAFVSHSSASLNNKPMFLLFICRNDNKINYKNETTDHHHHIRKVPNNQCTYRSNKYSESEEIHQHKIFNINLPVKLFPKDAMQETKDNHKSLDDCKSNGTQTRRHILDCLLSLQAYLCKIK